MLSRKKTKQKPKVKRPLFRKIINYFLGIGIGLLVIFLIAFGYTQTSSFRNWLKDFAIEQVNSSSNGKMAIGQLDGTIFTTLVLSNTSYIYEKDTLLTAEKIEIKIRNYCLFDQSCNLKGVRERWKIFRQFYIPRSFSSFL